MHRKGCLPPSLIGRYLLKRAAGFTRVCFQACSAWQEGQEDWIMMHNVFAVSLPQLAAVFAKYHVQMEIAVLQGGRVLFPDLHDHDPDDEELLDQDQYGALYWEVLAPVLTSLTLQIRLKDVPMDHMGWLNSMQQLQHLQIDGHDPSPERYLPYLCDPPQLSLSALKVLRLEKFLHVPDWHFDCPSLEALHLREIQGLTMPTGLGSCSRLTTLDVAAPLDLAHVNVDAGLRAAIKSVQGTLEILDISGWGPAFNDGREWSAILELVSRLPRLHTLVAQRNGLTALPALPASLKSLDLRANEFREVPVQLESLTQLTSLALSSKMRSANFQIRRPLYAIISLPQLRGLTLVLDANSHRPAHTRWDAQSLHYLGLAQHEISMSESRLLLKF